MFETHNVLVHCLSSRPRGIGSKWFPTYLLHITTLNARLITTAHERPVGPYATVSHCWGHERFFVLTTQNIFEFEAGISLSRFPNSFQDAISIARRLGIQYIWIDCYCIVQNSAAGEHHTAKLREIVQMKQVYANSILNIGATHASNPDEGCFIHRTNFNDVSELFVPRTVGSNQGKDMFQLCISADAVRDAQNLSSDTIFQRAWVFQERLLCPRMLHFGGEQLYWECQGLSSASEAFPCAHPRTESHAMFNIDDHALQRTGISTWCRIVQDYSAMSLSHPTEDKFVAIGGIAQCIAEAMNVKYFAGFLDDNLLIQLCWNIPFGSSISRYWRAPSWSWASIDGPVLFDLQTITTLNYRAMVHILSINVELTDPKNP